MLAGELDPCLDTLSLDLATDQPMPKLPQNIKWSGS
jgi:hypothetical protein